MVFLLNGTPGPPDSWAKAVLNIDSNSRSNSIFFVYNAKLKILFYCHGVGKITYDRFFERLLYLTASVKAERILFRLPAMRKKLRAMRHIGESWLCAVPHSAESRLRVMLHSVELKKKFNLRLRAIPLNFKFKSKIFLRHSAESIFIVEFNRIRIYMQNRFSPWIRGPRGTV
jgi:hypothetical protein